MYVQDLIDELENYHPDTQVFVLFTKGSRTVYRVDGISADRVMSLEEGKTVNGLILWIDDTDDWTTERTPIEMP
jgi:hypothetical protein